MDVTTDYSVILLLVEYQVLGKLVSRDIYNSPPTPAAFPCGVVGALFDEVVDLLLTLLLMLLQTPLPV